MNKPFARHPQSALRGGFARKVVIAILALLAALFVTSVAFADLPCVAITTDVKAPRGAPKIWGKTSKFWPQGKTLSVAFLGGSKSQQDKAWQRFEQIDALVGLKFFRSSTKEGHIRVNFLQSGHWSYLGTDALNIPKTRQTMNIQLTGHWLGDSAKEWDRVALHEILHAIGFEHEHQHPNGGVQLVWNKPAVYDYYQRTQGWSKSQIDFQVLNRYKGTDWKGTTYDTTSIMQYPVPEGLANIVIGWNSKLSATDVLYLKQQYP